jgi:AcrR family transcriptional regulator
MRTHGWAGELPHDEAQARQRILAATRACLAADGVKGAGTSDVARAVGVTRQTIYRYYATTEELLNAAALEVVGELLDQIAVHVKEFLTGTGGDAGDAVVEVLAYVYEHLRNDPSLNRLLTPGRLGGAVKELTAPSSILLGQSLLTRFPIDWDAIGLDEASRQGLVEHLLRTLQSLVLDPGTPERSGAELRAYLGRWIAPALRR